MIEADRTKRNPSRFTGYTQGERHLISKLGRVLRSHARYVHSTVQLYTIYGLMSSIARSLCGPELLETQVPSRRRLMLPTSKVHDQSPRFWGLSRHSYGVRNHSLRGSRVQVFSPPVFPLGFSSLAPTARQKLIRYKSAVKSWQGYRIQHRCTPCSLVHPPVRLVCWSQLEKYGPRPLGTSSTQSTSRRSLQHRRRYCAHPQLFSLAWPRLLRPVQPRVEAVDERLRVKEESVGSTRLPFGRRRRSFSWRGLKLVTNASVSLAGIAGYESSRNEALQHHHLLLGSDPSTGRSAFWSRHHPSIPGAERHVNRLVSHKLASFPGGTIVRCSLAPPEAPRLS